MCVETRRQQEIGEGGIQQLVLGWVHEVELPTLVQVVHGKTQDIMTDCVIYLQQEIPHMYTVQLKYTEQNK